MTVHLLLFRDKLLYMRKSGTASCNISLGELQRLGPPRSPVRSHSVPLGPSRSFVRSLSVPLGPSRPLSVPLGPTRSSVQSLSAPLGLLFSPSRSPSVSLDPSRSSVRQENGGCSRRAKRQKYLIYSESTIFTRKDPVLCRFWSRA